MHDVTGTGSATYAITMLNIRAKNSRHLGSYALALIALFAASTGCDDVDAPTPEELDRQFAVEGEGGEAEGAAVGRRESATELSDAAPEECDRDIRWGGECLHTGDEAPFPAGEYDVVALADDIPAVVRARVHAAAEADASAVFYTVQEEESLQYVLAAPHREDDSALPALVGGILADLGSPDASWTPCNRLYRYPGWIGSQFLMCAKNHGASGGYANLSSYGYNNVASSYYTDNGVGSMVLYNYYNYGGYLVELDWDDFNFSSSFDNKASSVKGYF